jgi:hypothetical protein
MVVNKKTIQLIIDKAFVGAWILFPDRSNPMFMMLGGIKQIKNRWLIYYPPFVPESMDFHDIVLACDSFGVVDNYGSIEFRNRLDRVNIPTVEASSTLICIVSFDGY